jgi:hypothetical protein
MKRFLMLSLLIRLLITLFSDGGDMVANSVRAWDLRPSNPF